MGYYTEYDLTLRLKSRKYSGCGTEMEIIRHFRDHNEDARFALTETGASDNPSKWYDVQKDLSEFSRGYPDYLFIMNCEGEEPGDLSKIYANAGKSYVERAKITIADFDESKLE